MSNAKEEFVKRIKGYEKTPVFVTDHAYERIKQRNISLDRIFENLLSNKNLIKAEKQSKNRYKCTYQKKGSAKECYVVSLHREQIKLITVFVVNRKLQKLINKNEKKIAKI